MRCLDISRGNSWQNDVGKNVDALLFYLNDITQENNYLKNLIKLFLQIPFLNHLF